MLPTTRRGETPFDLMQREFDRLADWPWAWRGGNGGQLTAAYPVDIREDDNHVYVEAELPGFKKDEIEVTMEQGILTINASRKQEERQGEEHLTERRFTRVSRSFRLPTPVDEGNIDAHLEEGVLTLTLPKREEVKPRRIEVK
ncbi:MAG: Hsp20/alpha crystallin family protein [Phycisphaeraceae bacterium]